MEFVLVQEWVDFDIEIRNYIVLPSFTNPISLKPRGIVYTIFSEQSAAGGFTNFNRFNREDCLYKKFDGDIKQLEHQEKQIEELIKRWLFVLQQESAELPVVVRFDMLTKYLGNGKSHVTTGELTELGGCFLGWEEGPQTIFTQILESYIGGHVTYDPITGSAGDVEACYEEQVK